MSPEQGSVSQPGRPGRPGGRGEHGEQGGEGGGGGGREMWQVGSHSQVLYQRPRNTFYTSSRKVDYVNSGSYRAKFPTPINQQGLISFHAGKPLQNKYSVNYNQLLWLITVADELYHLKMPAKCDRTLCQCAAVPLPGGPLHRLGHQRQHQLRLSQAPLLLRGRHLPCLLQHRRAHQSLQCQEPLGGGGELAGEVATIIGPLFMMDDGSHHVTYTMNDGHYSEQYRLASTALHPWCSVAARQICGQIPTLWPR